MDEDEVLEKITRLLERGCTMLATHHDCGAPLFRCQGEVVCPVCSFADSEPITRRGRRERKRSGRAGRLAWKRVSQVKSLRDLRPPKSRECSGRCHRLFRLRQEARCKSVGKPGLTLAGPRKICVRHCFASWPLSPGVWKRSRTWIS